MKFLARLFLSRRIAVGAMAALGLVLGLASFASGVDPDRLEALRAEKPVRVWVFENVRPEALTRSPAFLVLPGYIALAVAASIVQRVKSWRAVRRLRGGAHLERFVVKREARPALPPDAAEARLRDALRQCGLPPPVPGGLHGRRGDVGFAGSIVFHFGMLVTLVGVGVSAVQRFGGEVVLTEGAPMVVGPATMLRAEPADGLAGLAGTALSVSQVSASFGATGGLTDVSAVVEHGVPGEAPRRQMVSVNVPLTVRGYQLTLHRYGFAPGLVVTRPDGRVAADGVGVVRVLPPGTEDTIPLEGGGTLRLRFFPDHVLRGGAHATRSLQPLRPVLAWQWDEGGRAVASGTVQRGEEAVVAGYRVAFTSLQYWADFLVGRDPGVPWISLGALLVILGLAVRFAWHEQAWQATVTADGAGTVVAFSLSARYFPAALEQRSEKLLAALETTG